jgi:hypothetical protein
MVFQDYNGSGTFWYTLDASDLFLQNNMTINLDFGSVSETRLFIHNLNNGCYQINIIDNSQTNSHCLIFYIRKWNTSINIHKIVQDTIDVNVDDVNVLRIYYQTGKVAKCSIIKLV